MLFVEYKQTYDSIKQKILCRAMEKLGVPAKFTRMIGTCV